jgi:hypothetical protein
VLKTPLIACLAATVLVGGCATVKPDPSEFGNSRTYPDTREAVWRRILGGSARNAMFVTHADNQNGLISVEREIVSPQGGTVFDWADCGWGGVFEHTLSQRVELNYLVRNEQKGTSVTLNGKFKELRINIANRNAHWVTCSSTGVLEQELLESFYYD